MDDSIRVPIYELFSQAYQAIRTGDKANTERLCEAAWERIPEPKFGWDVTYMCLLGMVKCLRFAGRYDRAIALVDDYLASEYFLDYQDGPYFWLGTLYHEKDETSRAFEYLNRANVMSDGRCFVDEDPRYRRFYLDQKRKSGTKPV